MNIQAQLVKFLFITLPRFRRIIGNENEFFPLTMIRIKKVTSKFLVGGSHLVCVGCQALGLHHR